MLRRLRLYWSMLVYGLRKHRRFAAEHAQFYRDMIAITGPVRGRRVLEVGCGKMYWLSLLLHSDGALVTGIDTEVPMPGRRLAKYRAIWRRNGLERAVRTLVWDWVFAPSYYAALEQETGMQLVHEGLDLRTIDAAYASIPPASIDLVVSHEVFEHIADVGATLRELERLLKPTGRTYIYVHNFASLSGGHHIAWKYPDTEPSTSVPPWDHLRARRYPDIPSWLNELREADYRRLFSERFELVDWRYTPQEGRALLTPALREELRQYSGHELLTKGFTVIARTRT
jgi:SAM-dependent methyltransferase